MARSRQMLVAGGARDPNLLSLCHYASEMGIHVVPALVGGGKCPVFVWDMPSNTFSLDGEIAHPDAAFVRYDVFESMSGGDENAESRAMAWYAAIQGYAATNSHIRLPNRRAASVVGNKPAILAAARSVGLVTSDTIVTNSTQLLDSLPEPSEWIAKPVAGGAYCWSLEVAQKRKASSDSPRRQPALIQPKLIQPEIRIYRIGAEFFAFSMNSPSLDYRVLQDATVRPLSECPETETEQLAVLMDAVGLDFGAADFKTDPHSGKLVFLEVNSSPMFVLFDQVSDGSISRALVRYLTNDHD
jgi:hypothetical protein